MSSSFLTPMKKAGEVMGHPLWMLPMMVLGMLAMIEGVHTTAHWHQEMDVHGYCMRNREFIEKLENPDDY